MDYAYELDRKRIFVAGHRGMVGSAVVRRLEQENCEILITPREALDLRSQDAVHRWMTEARPDTVVLAAAKVGEFSPTDRYTADPARQFAHRNECHSRCLPL